MVELRKQLKNEVLRKEVSKWQIVCESGGGTTWVFADDLTEEEAIKLGNNYNWTFYDENMFGWSMYMEVSECTNN